MYMISKKYLNSAEVETLTTSRRPTTVITANGKVQTHEEATVFPSPVGTWNAGSSALASRWFRQARKPLLTACGRMAKIPGVVH